MNAITIVRNLLAAGWRANSYTEMADDSIIVDGTRGDSTITAVIADDGTASLTLTGLNARQVAAALAAVGHMPPIPAIPRQAPTGWSPGTRAAARMLRRLNTADLGDVASGRVALPPTGGAS